MYATIEQANAYVESYYSSTNDIRIAWEALSDGDKQIVLNRAEQVIDLLPFGGKPVDPKQQKAFPRHPHPELSLERVKTATIELALQQNGDIETQDRLNLRAQGVKSYKIGDLSETFKDTSSEDYIIQFALEVVNPFLRDWLGGGYRICPTRIRK